jgi:hypothetical protein
MDDLRTRLAALEHQTAALTHHAHRVTRQLRWWRSLACGLLALALLTWALPVTTAQEDLHRDWRGLPARVAALEQTLRHVTSGTDAEGRAELVITGANLRLVNGLSSTDCRDEQNEEMPDCPNGVGNLIVGYNEPRSEQVAGPNIRTGSHNIVVGEGNNFSRVGGLVVGFFNTISGDFAAVSGGLFNTASAFGSAVSGGGGNTASGDGSAVSGGNQNTASGFNATVSGGFFNTASGERSSVSGGQENTANGPAATVSGGFFNTASGDFASVSGGAISTASGTFAWVGGGQENRASGLAAAVSGGAGNTASGEGSAVSGGLNRTAAGEADWVAGSLFEDE